MRLLDTEVLIDIRRGYHPAVSWYSQLAEKPSVPGFVAMELMNGCYNKLDLTRMQIFLVGLPIVWPSQADCQRGL